MPFELPDGPPVTPEQMSEVLDKNPMTREVITKIFSDGVGILFCSSWFMASVGRRKRNGKIVPGFWEIEINLEWHKTRKDIEISILHELTHLHLWRVFGFCPSNDLMSTSLLGCFDPKFQEQRKPREMVIEDYAQHLSETEIITLEELLELGNALVAEKYSFGKPKYVFASSNPEFIDSALNKY